MLDSTQQDKQSQQILSPNPFPPYEGADPYIFVSYSRKDKNRVVPIITELHNRGYRVWYDAGIHAGEKWPAEIAAHVERCDVFMPLYTAAFNDSEWCNNEINHALSLKKTIIGVYLEDVQLKPEIQIRIRSFQHLAFRDGEDEEIFLNRMSREPNLISCLEQEKFLQWQTARQEAERKAREEAARQETERKAREEAVRREAERKAREEAARQETERKAREEAARQEAERKAREEAARREAERRAREEAARRETERKMREENSKREVMSAGRYFLFINQKDSPPRMVRFWSENGTPYNSCIQKTLALIFLIIFSAYLISTQFSEFLTWFTNWNWKLNVVHILLTIGTPVIAFCALFFLVLDFVSEWSETMRNNKKLKDWEGMGLTMRSLMGIGDVSCISVGKGDKPFVVGVFDDHTAEGKGDNSDGQLNVSNWQNIAAISAGYTHTVALCQDGTVLATGDKSHGKCNVSDWKDIVAVSAGGNHTVGLRKDGTVVAVGDNSHHQLDVTRWHDITAISAGWNHTVGLCRNGKVFAMGAESNGQIDVSQWQDIAMVSAGHNCTVGLRWDGTIFATGKYGSYDKAKWERIVAVSAGYETVQAMDADGKVMWTGHYLDYRDYPD